MILQDQLDLKENNFTETVSVELRQVENGAQIIDINMDDGLVDGIKAMKKFIHLISAEPEIARFTFTIDSSKIDILKIGLQSFQGKSLVNSISLKIGAKLFVSQAKEISKYGAGVVVMAFDAKRQAATKSDKIRICCRAYNISEHNQYRIDFIEATKEIRNLCSYSHISGGLSNLSFAYRGVNKLRGAMRSVFLYYAIENGMDFGIVDAGKISLFDDIESDLREPCIDAILNHDPSNIVERLKQKKRPELQKK